MSDRQSRLVVTTVCGMTEKILVLVHPPNSVMAFSTSARSALSVTCCLAKRRTNSSRFAVLWKETHVMIAEGLSPASKACIAN
jgi:hypothetical protein